MNRKPLITVVEHDPVLSMLLLEVLAESGHSTMLWTECLGALDFIRQMTPDLLILDLWLRQRGDGWQIFNHLQRDPATSRIPIILCADDSIQIEEARLIGRAVAVLEKPFDIERLLAVVAQVFETAGTELEPATQHAMRPALALGAEMQPAGR